ncbi:MAG: hypothetical protein JWQ13_2684, partial [Ramlibacter sp.]|nr:hypothetical protein [Ramlibacter sp.]
MARRNALIAALLVAVLAGHALVVEWLARQAQDVAALRLMTAPMFTRLLQPQAPPPAPVAAAKPSRPRAARAPDAIQSVAVSTPQEVTTSTPAVETVADTEAAASTPTAAVTPEPSEPASSTPAIDTASAALTPSTDAIAATPTVVTTASPGPLNLDSWPADTRLNYRLTG